MEGDEGGRERKFGREEYDYGGRSTQRARARGIRGVGAEGMDKRNRKKEGIRIISREV